jgi:hypothetical protein
VAAPAAAGPLRLAGTTFMERSVSDTERRKPYAKPRLVVYGPLAELTLTVAENNNMNDMFGNLKTL